MSKTLFIITILSTCFFSSGLTAQAYRWINDQGNVVYSQLPPPDNREVKVIEPPPPPVEESEMAQEKLDAQIKQLEETEQERKLNTQATAQREAEAKYNAQQCTNARQNLEAITNRPPQTLFKTGDGTYRRFTEEERAEQIKRANDIIEKYCR